MASEDEDDVEEGIENDFEDERDEFAAPAGDSSTSRRQLALRRSFEARREAREMDAALNYLELDVDKDAWLDASPRNQGAARVRGVALQRDGSITRSRIRGI